MREDAKFKKKSQLYKNNTTINVKKSNLKIVSKCWCRRYVTADAMGMAKERGRCEDEQCRWCRNRVGYKHGEGHQDVPRFGALRRDNTSTPACLLYINETSNYNK